MTAVQIHISADHTDKEIGSESRRIIQKNALEWYVFFARTTGGLCYKKTSDGGATWATAVTIGAGLNIYGGFGIYRRRWHDSDATDIVDIAAVQDAGCYHWQLNLSTDTLSSGTQVFATGSHGGGVGPVTCTVARSGRIFVTGGGVGGGDTYYSDNEGVAWVDATGNFWEQDPDQAQLWPDFAAADTNGVSCIYWDDDGVNELTVKRTTGGAITETLISANVSDDQAMTIDSSGNILIVAKTTDSPSHLKTWSLSGATATAKTNVLTSTNSVGLGISLLDSGNVVVWYTRGNPTGTVYYKVSTDGMTTWGTEQTYSSITDDMVNLLADPRPSPLAALGAAWFEESGSDDLLIEYPGVSQGSEAEQFRLMLAEISNPDVPTLNITSQNFAENAATLVRFERGRDAGVIGSPPRAGEASYILSNLTAGYELDEPTEGLATRLNKKYGSTWYHHFTGNVRVPGTHFGVGGQGFRGIKTIRSVGRIAKLQSKTISTELYQDVTTGTMIAHALDAAEFPSFLRDIDAGEVTLPWAWASGEDAWAFILKMKEAEGPTAELYEDGQGRIVFRSRSARYTETRSTDIQTTITSQGSAPNIHGPVGQPIYFPGSIDSVINYAEAQRYARSLDSGPTVVWTDNIGGTGSYILAPPGFPNSTLVLEAIATEPFASAITPVLNTDYAVGFGTVTVTLERTSGQRTRITFVPGAAGASIGPAGVNTGIQLRATITEKVGPFIEISTVDAATSMSKYGYRPWQGTMWADMNWADMRDNLDALVTLGQEPRGRVRFQIQAIASDSTNEAVAKRDIGDRIRLVETALDFDGECWIYRIEGEVHAPAASDDGDPTGSEVYTYECDVVSVAVGSQGTGVGETNPYDDLANDPFINPNPLDEQGVMTMGIIAGVFFGAGP